MKSMSSLRRCKSYLSVWASSPWIRTRCATQEGPTDPGPQLLCQQSAMITISCFTYPHLVQAIFFTLTYLIPPPLSPQRDVRRQINEFLDTDEGAALQHISSNITRDRMSHDTVCNIVHNLTPAGQVRLINSEHPYPASNPYITTL